MPIDGQVLFGGLADARGLVLAVSGGPDSTALMHLAAAWRPPVPVPLWVATVDHGLRPGSAGIADAVALEARKLGFAAAVLAWEGPKPVHGIQAKARAARYRLLTDFAAASGASHLVTAHTQDDQAETVLMRMAAGSGLHGLGGMRPITGLGAVTLVRPLLGIDKAALVALCRTEGWPFVEDPANTDPRYARARWRRLVPVLAAEGLTPARVAALADRLARADAVVQHTADKAAENCGTETTPHGRGYRATGLLGQPDEIVLRVLGKALVEVSGREQPRLQRLEALLAALRTEAAHENGLRRTLHGCVVHLERDLITVTREQPRRRGRAPYSAIP